MPIYLRQSTASQEVPLGHFLSSTDGDTAQTGLTIANTDIKLWVNGATTLASKNSGGGTHISAGVYYCVLDATDTATVGPLVIFIHVSGALAVRVECVVLAGVVYDVLFGSVALATVSNLTGGTITTVTNLTNAPTAGDLTATMKTSVTAAVPTAAAVTAALLAGGDVDGFTLEQTLKLCLAALAGKLSGAATTTVAIRAADDSKARITATVDSSGNRSVVTLDGVG